MKDKEPIHAANRAFAKRQKEVVKFSDPKTLTEHLATHTQEYSHAAPNTTLGLNASVMRAQQFLQSKLPLPGNSLPLSGEHKPSRTAVAKFNHYYDTVNDPVGVFNHVKKGTLKNEHVEALQAVYPQLYGEMKKKVVEHMNPEKARTLPYGTRIAIAKFMGQPMDASMLPQAIISNQMALTGPRLGSQGTSKSTKTTLGGLKELKMGERADTETNNLEEDKN